MNREEKIGQLNSFFSLCQVKSTGKTIESKHELIYQTVSKVEVERYSTQLVEKVKVFVYSAGKVGNNTPYTYPEELPIGTGTIISNDLCAVRTLNTDGYGYGTIRTDIPAEINYEDNGIIDLDDIDPDLIGSNYDFNNED